MEYDVRMKRIKIKESHGGASITVVVRLGCVTCPLVLHHRLPGFVVATLQEITSGSPLKASFWSILSSREGLEHDIVRTPFAFF